MTPKKSTRDHKRSFPGKCLIDSCTSRRGYRLPAGGSLLQEWQSALKLDPGLKPSLKSVICAKHFELKAFQPARQSLNGAINLILTDDAVPSVFPATRKISLSSSGNLENEADESAPGRRRNSTDDDVTILSSDVENRVTPGPEKKKRENTNDSQVKKKRKRMNKNSSQSESTSDEEDPPQTLVCKDEDDIYSDDSDVILCEKPVDTVDLTSQPSSPEPEKPANSISFDGDGSSDSDCQIVQEVITLVSDEEKQEEETTRTLPLDSVVIDSDNYSSNSRDSIPETNGGSCTRVRDDDKSDSDSSGFRSPTSSPTSLTPYSARIADFSWGMHSTNGPGFACSSSSEETADNDESTLPPVDFVNLESESSVSNLDNLSNNNTSHASEQGGESCGTPVEHEGEPIADLEVEDCPAAEDKINEEKANSVAKAVFGTAGTFENCGTLDSEDRLNVLELESTGSTIKNSTMAESLVKMDSEVETSCAEPFSRVNDADSVDTDAVSPAVVDPEAVNLEVIDPDAVDPNEVELDAVDPVTIDTNPDHADAVKPATAESNADAADSNADAADSNPDAVEPVALNPDANVSSIDASEALNMQLEAYAENAVSLDASKEKPYSGADELQMNESRMKDVPASGNSRIFGSKGEFSVTVLHTNGYSPTYNSVQLEKSQKAEDSHSPSRLETPPDVETDIEPVIRSVDSEAIYTQAVPTEIPIDCHGTHKVQRNCDGLTMDLAQANENS